MFSRGFLFGLVLVPRVPHMDLWYHSERSLQENLVQMTERITYEPQKESEKTCNRVTTKIRVSCNCVLKISEQRK